MSGGHDFSGLWKEKNDSWASFSDGQEEYKQLYFPVI